MLPLEPVEKKRSTPLCPPRALPIRYPNATQAARGIDD
jgi:hypothetical protein